MENNDMEKEQISFAESKYSVSSSNNEEGIDTQIEISINSVENIIRNDSFLMKIIVQHEDIILGESKFIEIHSNYKNVNKVHPIDFKVGFPYLSNNTKSIAPLVSSPLIIQVFEAVQGNNKLNTSFESQCKDKIKTKSRIDSKKELKILGICNIDILSIILGEIINTEKLVLEVPSYTWDNNTVSWENLPKISITLQQDETKIITNDLEFNLMNITVESIYNTPTFFTKNMNYKCGTVIYPDKNISESCIIFETNKCTNFRDIESTKTWRPLQNLKSRARLSKYKINCDYNIFQKDFKQFNLKAAIENNTKRIEWNTIHRCFLNKKDIGNMRQRLKKYKYWPFEILVTKRQDEHEENVLNNKGAVIYQCYVDTSQLLFPGRQKSRVLTQLYLQNIHDIKEKTGLEKSIFNNDILEESKSDTRISSLRCPVFTENEEPVLILIEFELYRPLFPGRILEDFIPASEILKNKTKSKGLFYPFTSDLVQDQYLNSIKQLVDVLGESYRDFLEHCDCESSVKSSDYPSETFKSKYTNLKKMCNLSNSSSFINQDTTCHYFYLQDELSRFTQFLHETGKYVSIRNTLKNKIINLLDQKFPMNSSDWFSTENQDFISSCYTYLVEQMHIALNLKIDVRLNEEISELENFEKLWFLAEEAYEFNNYEKVKKLVIKIVSNDRSNPDSWIIYAIYFLKKSEIDEAIECCREAIRLCSRHKIALLTYGVILVMKKEYSEAEIFLKAVTHFYPRFAEGWASLHLLYVKMQYHPGISITLEIAGKCLKDKIMDKETLVICDNEPIAWSTILCRKNHIFLLTAVLLLKLNLYDFASLALTQELCHGEQTVEFLYFYSVNAYLHKNYKIALSYLNQAEIIIGLEYSIASLMGHLYYKFGNIVQAIKYYESVDMLYERPENIHLVHLRMGYYFIDIEEYEHARNIFSRTCKYSSTGKSWLGFGISNYHLKSFQECEMALMEANRIDDEDPEVWAYLCLLSMSLHRSDEFSQCYRQMVKNNLKNDKLWQLIKLLMNTLDYSSPIVVFENSNDECVCKRTSYT